MNPVMESKLMTTKHSALPWRITYDNDTGPCDESFCEWWCVTNGERYFEIHDEADANWLRDTLTAQAPLIEAATEALKWLETAQNYEPDDCENPELGEAVNQLRAALALVKQEGEK